MAHGLLATTLGRNRLCGCHSLTISWGQYFKTGVILTLPTLTVTLLGLY
ncbi:ArsB/NhaD family transporter [Brevibacillus sp. 179-C1.2 HS]